MATRHGLAVGLAVEPFWRDDFYKDAIVVDANLLEIERIKTHLDLLADQLLGNRIAIAVELESPGLVDGALLFPQEDVDELLRRHVSNLLRRAFPQLLRRVAGAGVFASVVDLVEPGPEEHVEFGKRRGPGELGLLEKVLLDGL